MKLDLLFKPDYERYDGVRPFQVHLLRLAYVLVLAFVGHRNIAFVDELYPDVSAGIVVRLKDDRKTELGVARDRVRKVKELLGI
jgi:hypothetical protein